MTRHLRVSVFNSEMFTFSSVSLNMWPFWMFLSLLLIRDEVVDHHSLTSDNIHKYDILNLYLPS